MSELLNGRYDLHDVVGAGGMGAVYRATDTRLGRTVAVKALRGGALADEIARARMRSEARLASTVHHPGVAQIYDFDACSATHGGMAFIVMEYVEGRTLAQLLREQGRLPVDQVLSILQQVAEALTAAHAAGVVHRDLKPANLILTASGRAVLVDFGIASSADSDPLTETGALIGTADYLSPEQAAGRHASPLSDIYSLGVVAYQCLSGTSPFRRDHHLATALAHLQDTLPALDTSVPPAVRALVEDMTEKNPVDRPVGAAEVARRTAAARVSPASGVPTEPVPLMPATPPSRERKHRRRPVALYSGITAAAVVAAFVVGIDRSDPDEAGPQTPAAVVGNPDPIASPAVGTPEIVVTPASAPATIAADPSPMSADPSSGSTAAVATSVPAQVSAPPTPTRGPSTGRTKVKKATDKGKASTGGRGKSARKTSPGAAKSKSKGKGRGAVR